jgi:hypothetical protein
MAQRRPASGPRRVLRFQQRSCVKPELRSCWGAHPPRVRFSAPSRKTSDASKFPKLLCPAHTPEAGREARPATPGAGVLPNSEFGLKSASLRSSRRESALTFPPSTPWRGEAERRRLNPQLSTHSPTTILAGEPSAYGGGLWRPFSRLATRFFFPPPVSFACLFGRKSGQTPLKGGLFVFRKPFKKSSKKS